MTQETKSYSEQGAHDLATGTHYRFRAECRSDCDSIFMVLRPWIVDWFESDGIAGTHNVVASDELHWVSRCRSRSPEVMFVLESDGPSLNEIRWLVNSLQDCHVAAETLEPLDSYTGERMDYELLDEIATRPNKAVIEAAMESIADCQKFLFSESERAAEAIQQFEAHIGNPDQYMRKVALQQATFVVKHGLVKGDIDCTKLAEVFYQNMTFDSSGTHIRLPGF